MVDSAIVLTRKSSKDGIALPHRELILVGAFSNTSEKSYEDLYKVQVCMWWLTFSMEMDANSVGCLDLYVVALSSSSSKFARCDTFLIHVNTSFSRSASPNQCHLVQNKTEGFRGIISLIIIRCGGIFLFLHSLPWWT